MQHQPSLTGRTHTGSVESALGARRYRRRRPVMRELYPREGSPAAVNAFTNMPMAAVAILGTVAGKWLSSGEGLGRRLATIVGAGDPWIYFGYAFLLMLLSGTLSGLILGLLSQTEGELKEMIQGVDPKKAAAARKCLPLRKLDNELLCTLLLVNVAVNAALTVVVDTQLAPHLGNQAVGIVATAAVIFLFGEMIPQAICNTYGLQIGAALSPFVWVLVFSLKAFSWPLGKALDWALHGNPEEDEEMLLENDSASYAPGPPRQSSRLQDIVKPLSGSFTLSEEDVVDNDMLAAVKRSGQQGIPVKKHIGSTEIVAMVMASDFVNIDPQSRTPLKQLLMSNSA